MKFSDEQEEDLIHFSLQMNRQRNHELRDEFEEYDDMRRRQIQTLEKKNLEIARLKTQRAIFAILAAASIGYSLIDHIIDAHREKSVPQIQVEPASSLREL